MTDAIARPSRVTVVENPSLLPEIGRWFWLKIQDNDGKPLPSRLVCVVRIGSNYVKVEDVEGNGWRIHTNEWDAETTPEPDADAIISREIAEAQQRVQVLMAEVHGVTARLGVSSTPLAPHEETQALAVSHGSAPVEEYKQALVLAKDKTLPALFEAIKEENRSMGEWMKAKLIPMLARAKALEPTVEAIKSRIFNVELYAGLVETIVQIKDGAPAAIGEPIRIFQRRAYMDEECLAEYETGGMEYKDIDAFDEWLAKPQNVARLLPFERSVIAFRVRREDKEREVTSYTDFIVFAKLREWDKKTFLYFRNGEQIFRLSTEIEFEEKLFPDIDAHDIASGGVYAKMYGNDPRNLLTEVQYEGRRAAEAKRKKDLAAHERKLKAEGVPKNEWYSKTPWALRNEDYDIRTGQFIKWTPETVYYDDIAAYVKRQMEQHNRLFMVMQGVLDRSPVFQPHPPWRLWEADDYGQGVRLIYDDSRALAPVDLPDFEAYRAKLNASIRTGSITIGQESFWMRREADKENERRANSWLYKSSDDVGKYWKPDGDEGPGYLARVRRISPSRGGQFEWYRRRTGAPRRQRFTFRRVEFSEELVRRIFVPLPELFNVSAYTPGDFKQFFNDPRTRADYLQWAPLLLAAEEWHAGNRALVDGSTVNDDHSTPPTKKKRRRRDATSTRDE